MGRSRSATCVLMYIMKRFGVNFEDALEYVKIRREDVDPNEGFLTQLREFEAQSMDFGSLLFNRPVHMHHPKTQSMDESVN